VEPTIELVTISINQRKIDGYITDDGTKYVSSSWLRKTLSRKLENVEGFRNGQGI
jgi:hypothetical protein